MSENKIQISEKYKENVKGLTHDKLILVPLEVLESLHDFYTWKEFISTPNFIEEKSSIVIEKYDKVKFSFDDEWDNYSGTHFGY